MRGHRCTTHSTSRPGGSSIPPVRTSGHPDYGVRRVRPGRHRAAVRLRPAPLGQSVARRRFMVRPRPGRIPGAAVSRAALNPPALEVGTRGGWRRLRSIAITSNLDMRRPAGTGGESQGRALPGAWSPPSETRRLIPDHAPSHDGRAHGRTCASAPANDVPTAAGGMAFPCASLVSSAAVPASTAGRVSRLANAYRVWRRWGGADRRRASRLSRMDAADAATCLIDPGLTRREETFSPSADLRRRERHRPIAP